MGGFSLLDRLDQRLVAVEQVEGDEGRGSLPDSRHQRTIHRTEIRAPGYTVEKQHQGSGNRIDMPAA
jgi:hypothetical protein